MPIGGITMDINWRDDYTYALTLHSNDKELPAAMGCNLYLLRMDYLGIFRRKIRTSLKPFTTGLEVSLRLAFGGQILPRENINRKSSDYGLMLHVQDDNCYYGQ